MTHASTAAMRVRVLFCLVTLASPFAFACSSSSVGNGPDTSDVENLTPDAEQELVDLGIGSDELVADEAASDDDLLALVWPEVNPGKAGVTNVLRW